MATRRIEKKVKELEPYLKMLKRAEEDLLEKKGIALGCWRIPEGAKPTFNRSEWFHAAKDAGVLSPELELWLKRWWAGLWLRDLSD